MSTFCFLRKKDLLTKVRCCAGFFSPRLPGNNNKSRRSDLETLLGRQWHINQGWWWIFVIHFLCLARLWARRSTKKTVDKVKMINGQLITVEMKHVNDFRSVELAEKFSLFSLDEDCTVGTISADRKALCLPSSQTLASVPCHQLKQTSCKSSHFGFACTAQLIVWCLTWMVGSMNEWMSAAGVSNYHFIENGKNSEVATGYILDWVCVIGLLFVSEERKKLIIMPVLWFKKNHWNDLESKSVSFAIFIMNRNQFLKNEFEAKSYSEFNKLTKGIGIELISFAIFEDRDWN